MDADISQSHGYASIPPRCLSCGRGNYNCRKLFDAGYFGSYLPIGDGPVLRVLWRGYCKFDLGRVWNTVHSVALDTAVSRPEAADAQQECQT